MYALVVINKGEIVDGMEIKFEFEWQNDSGEVISITPQEMKHSLWSIREASIAIEGDIGAYILVITFLMMPMNF